MPNTEDVLTRIDEVLGFTDDMSIEWDHDTSPDAMRSRPADEIPEQPLLMGGGYITDDVGLDAAHWEAMWERLAVRDGSVPALTTAWLDSGDLTTAIRSDRRRPQDRFTLGFDGSRSSDTIVGIRTTTEGDL